MPKVKARTERRPRRDRRRQAERRWNERTSGKGQRSEITAIGGDFTAPRVEDIPIERGAPGSLGEPKAWVNWGLDYNWPKGRRAYPQARGLAQRNLYRRPLQWKGAIVNPELSLGQPPFEGINEERCKVCGEKIEDWRAGITWDDGAQLIRQASKNQDVKGGGWRTRGPVLWAMHFLKVTAWWERHSFGGCRWLWDVYDGGRPIPRALSWACFYGGPGTAGGDCLTFGQVKALVDMGRPKPSLWPANVMVAASSITWDVRGYGDKQIQEMNREPLTVWQRDELEELGITGAELLAQEQSAQREALVAALDEADIPW
jgi:hypothetical protein